MEHLVRRAVETIYQRHGEPLYLDELAEDAMVSKFHFLRLFSRVTGVTPGRFLGAVRLQEAKRLLLTSSLNVADISAQVGYSSTGTFTRRFTKSVGLSPTEYRRLTRQGWSVPSTARAGCRPRAAGVGQGAAVAGRAHAEGELHSKIYVGVFESAIVQGPAVSWDVIGHGEPFTLTGVPAGTWFVHAVANSSCAPAAPLLDHAADPPVLGATVGPVVLGPGSTTRVDLTLRPLGWARPPILLALPSLEPFATVA
ncbi:helix-turn-helix transcriptional regulator [Actinomadura sp. NAK00032]|uniref:helix-turn-helix transcriptional regulator n=1 Tax=Actinomadura sp. NAK00032 TaxID=2742128 RepID=UPI001592474C|nr:AraC family transcriptional regulator [Actinomadura sp. NAK00032]QKW37592.1 helix-turn-helix transcriptional regulator [Actinomadura sp. NAK00032]